MELQWIQTLFDYNEWANRQTLEMAAGLSAEEYAQEMGTSFKSVRGTLRHILNVQVLWLSRWGASEFPGFLKEEDVPDLASLTARWAPVEEQARRYVASLTPADLLRENAYTDTKGSAHQHPLWVQLVNFVNHGTHHRGQVTTLLRQLGKEPVQNDIVYYHTERQHQG